MDAPRPTGCLTTLALGAGLALFGLAGDVALLRSFEFFPGPKWLSPYTPPAPAEPNPVAPIDPLGPRPSQGVTIFFADGMRLGESRELPAYNALRAEGADVVTRCLFPTYTRVGQATIQTGGGPRTHGYLANYNRRKASVMSLGDMAREAGVHTRYVAPALHDPYMFPEASVERLVLDVFEPAEGPRPYLTLVYYHQPDATAHKQGGGSEAYRQAALEADGVLASIRARMDLTKETLVVVTDHGHIDRGGHGGHEEVVFRIPLILAGAGIKPGVALGREAGSDLRDVAPTVALLLGLPRPPHATGRPLYEVLADPPPEHQWVERGPLHPEDPVWALVLRLLLGLLPGVAALALATRTASPETGGGQPRPSLKSPGGRLVAGALAAPVLFMAAYGARGYPFSYSCVNAEAEVPGFMLEVLILAILASGLGAAISGNGRKFGHLAAGVALVWAGVLSVGCGWGAPKALDYPRLAFHAHMALTFCLALGLAIPLVGVHAPRSADPDPPA